MTLILNQALGDCPKKPQERKKLKNQLKKTNVFGVFLRILNCAIKEQKLGYGAKAAKATHFWTNF